MKFEIVNHSYHYSRLLAYQLSSLVLYHDQQDLDYTIFCDSNDLQTMATIKYFMGIMPSNVRIYAVHQDIRILRNRAVGRNERAKHTKADWIWFTDTDHMFINRCWADLAREVLNTRANFVWPTITYETDWPTGDKLISDMCQPAVRDVSVTMAQRKAMRFAIGGVQIARGDIARTIGYCPNRIGPREDWDFKSDIKFRRAIEPREGITLDHVIRIRHSQKGYRQENRHEVVN